MVYAKSAYQEQVFHRPKTSREEPRIEMSQRCKIIAFRMLGVLPVTVRHDCANGTYHKSTEQVICAFKGVALDI